LLLKASTIASMRYALDRDRSRAAWFLKAGKPAFDIAKRAGGRPRRFADASLPGSLGIPSNPPIWPSVI
jgi:hypothetical protein